MFCDTFNRLKYVSLCLRQPTIWVPTSSDTNWAVQSLTMVRGFKFCIKVEEGLYYPCSENKGTDQLRSFCEADLRLCFLPKHFVDFLMQWLMCFV